MGPGSGNTVLYSGIPVKDQMSGVLAPLEMTQDLRSIPEPLMEEENKFLGGFL